MTESIAEVLGLAAVIPGGTVLILLFLSYGQLIHQLQNAHKALWIELGQPALFWGGSRGSLLRLIVWVSTRGYAMTQNIRTTTLGNRCRYVYLGMVAVALWILGIIILWSFVGRLMPVAHQ